MGKRRIWLPVPSLTGGGGGGRRRGSGAKWPFGSISLSTRCCRNAFRANEQAGPLCPGRWALPLASEDQKRHLPGSTASTHLRDLNKKLYIPPFKNVVLLTAHLRDARRLKAGAGTREGTSPKGPRLVPLSTTTPIPPPPPRESEHSRGLRYLQRGCPVQLLCLLEPQRDHGDAGGVTERKGQAGGRSAPTSRRRPPRGVQMCSAEGSSCCGASLSASRVQP